jgi:hypothetical protein
LIPHFTERTVNSNDPSRTLDPMPAAFGAGGGGACVVVVTAAGAGAGALDDEEEDGAAAGVVATTAALVVSTAVVAGDFPPLETAPMIAKTTSAPIAVSTLCRATQGRFLSSTQTCQPSGGGPQVGSGCQPGGGTQPVGGVGQVGGGL